MLRDRNTVKMVADYWMVSDETIYRLIRSGALACLRLQGTIRLTREQVEAYEAAYSTKARLDQELAQAETRLGNDHAIYSASDKRLLLKKSRPRLCCRERRA